MAHISTASLYSGIILVLLFIQTVQCRPSTQSDIDNVANHLRIKVFVETNHLSTGTYDIAYHLSNSGNTKILDTDDWMIIFSMHNRDMLTQPEFQVHGFTISHYKDSLYKMTSIPGRFPGLNRGQAFKITIKANGLSVFRQDIHPRFIVQSPNTTPRTIKSTDDDELKFVELTVTGDPRADFSKMTGVQRTIMIPDVADIERVPPTIIVPPPRNITISPQMPLLDLSAVSQFYVWPDNAVSKIFIDYFKNIFTTIPAVTPNKLRFVNSEPPANADKIYIQQTGPEAGKSPDYYKLAVRPKVPGVRDFNLIHMSATSEEGLHNAVESLMAAAGLYEILPDMTVEDDARFGHRSLSLDLTKNFIPSSTIKKVLKLMSMYKLNKLVLNLGDDYAWRLVIPGIDALSQYGGQRCQSKNEHECMPPYYGSGATVSPPGSGYFTVTQFSDILREAASKHIDVIPKFNFLGGSQAAKQASHHQYMQLAKTNPQEAERFHLMSKSPDVPAAQIPEDSLSADGLLDPCIDQTYAFMGHVVQQVYNAYKNANIRLKAFHAGGDELTQFLGKFPSCKTTPGVSSTADALRKMIGALQGLLTPINAVLHVNEEAIIDPSTNDCITIPGGSPMSQNNLVTHFYKTFPGSPDDWNLSPEQLAFMDGEVIPPNPADPTTVADPLKLYTGQKKGLTSWIMPYRCANRGFKIVLEPENFFSLDSPYELDFDEPGNRKMRRFHVINMHRMMMYEPMNHYINMDLGKDGYTFLQYRMCKLFPCETLTKPENILGMGATVDTSVIRTENMLWKMLLPRLLCFAEKAWREGEHENILKAEEPNTLVVPENLEMRSGAITVEINNLMNNIAYKEGGRLDENGFFYRVPTLGASIHLGLVFNRPPPYPLMFKADMPALEVEYRDITRSADAEWTPLFNLDPNTGAMTGGYTFDFPESNQKIELRALSSGGRNETLNPKRYGRTVLVTGAIDNYLPREVPIEIREGTCLPIEEPWTTEFENITTLQWKRLLQNMAPVVTEQSSFMENRQQVLEATVRDHNNRYRGNSALPMVFQAIQNALGSGQNISTFPATNILRVVYEKDMEIYERRSRFVENRYRDWQQEYLRCKAGRSRPTLLPEPRGRVAGVAAGRVAGAAQGIGPGGVPGGQGMMPGASGQAMGMAGGPAGQGMRGGAGMGQARSGIGARRGSGR